MARPKSDDRRAALLDAATEIFAERGLGAPTAAIARRAKVSEGSFFTYFKTKDELVNALYRDLRLQVADAVITGFPRRGGVRARLEHIWDGYVTWGAEHHAARKALRLVSMSHVITPEVRAESSVLFAEVDGLEREALAQKLMKRLPPGLSGAVLKALGEMTMDLMAQQPKRAAELRAAGFELLWDALHR
jgi:AcrR family transcriptional regulator